MSEIYYAGLGVKVQQFMLKSMGSGREFCQERLACRLASGLVP